MEDLEARLEEALLAKSPTSEFYRIVQQLERGGASLEDVTAILRVMEGNPEFDFGVPGPLVHFVETFYRKGYEAELLASLERRPTPHTVWMLNRIINDTNEPAAHRGYIAALRAAGRHAMATQRTRESVAEFLQLHDDV
jgi:hypothetical protein